jgi:hypothetical protein
MTSGFGANRRLAIRVRTEIVAALDISSSKSASSRQSANGNPSHVLQHEASL